MNIQEVSLLLKGCVLAKEGSQIVAIGSTSFEKHKSDCLLDFLSEQLFPSKTTSGDNLFHSLSFRETRKYTNKRKRDFSRIVEETEEGEKQFEEYLGELEKKSEEKPAMLVYSGFEYLLKYLSPKRLVKLMETLRNLQSKHLSKFLTKTRNCLHLLFV